MRKRILIVDDNTELLQLLCLAVKDAGFSVASASTGIEGLDKARSLRPDLLVLDLVLPEMDGFAVCEAVRRDSTLTDLPIIMLTGLTGEFTRLAGLESGANEYVKKPVSPDELVSRIRFWLNGGQAHQPGLPQETPNRKALGSHSVRSNPDNGPAQAKSKSPQKIFSLRK